MTGKTKFGLPNEEEFLKSHPWIFSLQFRFS